MRKLSLFHLFLIAFTFLHIVKIYGQEQLSPRNANYDISVSLDVNTKILKGKQTLTWTNITSVPTDELQFHLYLNAFKNTQSTFMKESKMRHRGFTLEKDDTLSWGWIEINSMNLKDGTSLTEKIEFIQPDDTNSNDKTVIKVDLPNEVSPGETIVVEFDFTSKLPMVMARTGFKDEYFLVGQWFPKIGVFEDIGQRGRSSAGWNCHQFHANSEFYADFGNYNVEITIPNEYIVGATGLMQSETQNSEGTKTVKYFAADVIDFAWTASPLFKVVKDNWKDVEISLLIQPQHMPQAERHIVAVKNAFEYFEKYLGKYPYPSMTIVDPPFRALASAGMEYPMFITAGCIWGIPENIRFTETVTIHELAHNYFMGILASNEFEEAWLDEGFTTHFENRIMDHYYGEKHSVIDLFGYHIGDAEFSRRGYVGMRNPYVANLSNWSWDYKDGGYGASSYSKPGVILETMENILGDKLSNEVYKTYYEGWKFKHPSTQDFIDVVNDVVSKYEDFPYGKDMNWYFDQTIKTGEICDYKVTSISNVRKRNDWGIYGDGAEKSLIEDKERADSTYKYITKTILTRIGEVKIPQDVLIHFENGEEVLEKWDGQSRTKSFTYQKDSKIDWVQIDPERKILLDIKLHNNSLRTKNDTSVAWKYAAKVLFWIQSTMTTFFF